ncbi:MAG: helix-turn-helix domain-containing protein [Deferribacteraceae bacterium]|jgi:transcriptional regulator with XRE-family HTH domain|nr:helix-turn-helix domain-containing protein [Deferribacteraceae bacterium]
MVGNRVRTLRIQNGFSQEELAHQSNIHATTLSELESGKANITLITCESIAMALNVSVSSLFPENTAKEDDEISRLIASIQKIFTHCDMKEKARYIRLMRCLTDNFL